MRGTHQRESGGQRPVVGALRRHDPERALGDIGDVLSVGSAARVQHHSWNGEFMCRARAHPRGEQAT